MLALTLKWDHPESLLKDTPSKCVCGDVSSSQASMYVLCTLVLLSLHNLFRRPRVLDPVEPKAIESPEKHKPDVGKHGRKKRNKHHIPGSSGPLETSRVHRQSDVDRCLDGFSSRASKRRSVHQDNVLERRKIAQVSVNMEVKVKKVVS